MSVSLDEGSLELSVTSLQDELKTAKEELSQLRDRLVRSEKAKADSQAAFENECEKSIELQKVVDALNYELGEVDRKILPHLERANGSNTELSRQVKTLSGSYAKFIADHSILQRECTILSCTSKELQSRVDRLLEDQAVLRAALVNNVKAPGFEHET